jgi:hypothetical protein
MEQLLARQPEMGHRVDPESVANVDDLIYVDFQGNLSGTTAFFSECAGGQRAGIALFISQAKPCD